ncbi:MAG: MoxR-like ATPase [Myxococcota bacterium]|jgi:MoxR-like ATPase
MTTLLFSLPEDDDDRYVYRFPAEAERADLILAVNVAIAARRPLLITGPPGNGKSTLAASIARIWKAKLYTHAITSRTAARDLLWWFDAVQRLSDASVSRSEGSEGTDLPTKNYISPGVLWWAFDPVSAAVVRADTHQHQAPNQNGDPGCAQSKRVVVLLDEIDKADPDIPNDLLIPLGSYRFTVRQTGQVIEHRDPDNRPLIVITTNGVRRLPEAFLRRCVRIDLGVVGRDGLIAIAQRHFPEQKDNPILAAVADKTLELRDDITPRPSTAEYLDAVCACLTLGITPESPEWKTLERVTLLKPEEA